MNTSMSIGNATVPFFLGALPFGSTVDDQTSFAILDRFREAGGTLLDTANNYVAWADGCTGDESEGLLGRWLATRRARDEMYLATKLGARPDIKRGSHFPDNVEGLSSKVVRSRAEDSLRRLGTDRLDLLYAHIEDRATPIDDTVTAFAELVTDDLVGSLGCSNHAVWSIERARATARSLGVAGYQYVQQRHTYLRPRPGADFGIQRHTDDELLDYAKEEEELTLLGYSTLLSGAYTRADKPLPAAYDHPDSTQRLKVLAEVAHETGGTANQVVLAWLMGGDPAVVPVVGVSSVVQLDECLGAVDLELDADLRQRLDEAGPPASE